MEMLTLLLAATIPCGVMVVLYAWKILKWMWFRPKKLEKCLIQQGFNGNPYKLFFGDSKETSKLQTEALSKPMSFTHEIVPRALPTFHHAIQKYGKNFFQWFGPRPVIMIWEPELVREVLSKSYVYQKPPPSNPGVGRVLSGLALYETDKWAKHRKLINPAFHIDKLKHMVPSFYLSCADMLSKWDNIVPKEGSCELDVWPYLQTAASDAISRTAFGSSYEEGRKIFELQKEQIRRILEANRSVYILGWSFLPSEHKRRMNEIREEIDSAVMAIINKRMGSIKSGEGSGDDLLGLLLESNLNEIEEHGSKFGMSMQEVIAECKIFYIAGQETTASLLVWTMILLSKYTDWQARAREEVLQAIGTRKPEYEELNHLKTINMIFHEVMRLYPPGPVLTRMTTQESRLGNLMLPAGVQLLLPAIFFNHDKNIWGDDAEEFNPERFSEGVFKATQGYMSYIPFGGGPRVCIGQNFAMIEAKITMSMILQRYSFELSPSYSHAPYAAFTLHPQNGAQLSLYKLKD